MLAVIAASIALSLFRAARDFRARRAEAICWQATFPDLPARERVCRHEFTGEFPAPHLRPRLRLPRMPDARRARRRGIPAAAATEATDVSRPRLPRSTASIIAATPGPIPSRTATSPWGWTRSGARLVADPEAVELPAVGSHIQTNGAAWHVRKRGANVRILSPLDGEVVATGGPRDPAGILKVKPDGGRFDARHLLRGAEIRPWITREMERLQAALTPATPAPTMADGGVPVDDIAAGYPDADWDTVCAEIFLQP